MYFEELKRSMEWLASHEDTIFLGQAVSVPGTAMFSTLVDVNHDKKVELPVAMGMSQLRSTRDGIFFFFQ